MVDIANKFDLMWSDILQTFEIMFCIFDYEDCLREIARVVEESCYYYCAEHVIGDWMASATFEAHLLVLLEEGFVRELGDCAGLAFDDLVELMGGFEFVGYVVHAG